MVLSPPSDDGWYQGLGKMLYGSSFNMKWPRQLGIEPKVIIDAGSYDGGDAYRFRKAFPDALIIAVEADPDRLSVTELNLRDQGMIVLSFAAADRNGILSWYQSTERGLPGSGGSLYKMNAETKARFKQADKPTQVVGRTLEHACRGLGIDQIDILHMDVEGATLPALRGLGPMRPRMIYTEMADCWIGGPSSSDAHEWLLAEGYTQVAAAKKDRLYFR